jgi:hypothetical protein
MSKPAPDRQPRIRDRHVLLLATAIVAAVLGLQALSIFVPAIGEVVGLAPVLIGALIIVTVVVLGRALRPRRPPEG